MSNVYASGGYVKALPNRTIGGFSIVFGGKDRQGEFFSKDSSLDLEDRKSLPVYWHHRRDPELGHSLGRAQFQVRGDTGVWTEFRLPADSSGEQLYALAEKGSLGWSSGSAPHLVERVPTDNGTWLKTWVVCEVSVCPADLSVEPRAVAVALKAFYNAVVTTPRLSAEQRALNAKAEFELARFENISRECERECERSFHADSRDEEQAYYSAMLEFKVAQHELKMRKLRNG